MATESDKDYLKRAERTSDPALQEGDADTGAKNAVDGFDMELAGELKDAQTAGSRNDRATEYSGVKHNTEPYGTGQTPGAEQNEGNGAVGITSRRLSEEKKEAGHVRPHSPEGNEGAFADDVREQNVQGGDLPSGEAERVETVEVSTMTPKR